MADSPSSSINWGDTLFMAGVALVVCVAVLAVFPSMRGRISQPQSPEPSK